jgi:hypothetical protein
VIKGSKQSEQPNTEQGGEGKRATVAPASPGCVGRPAVVLGLPC